MQDNNSNTHTRALKNLTFPNYNFGGGKYAFYPSKLSRFANKKDFVVNRVPLFVQSSWRPKEEMGGN